MAVATSIVAGSAITAGASIYAGKQGADATAAGASNAAQATIESTRMQTEELGRQFDEQMKMLAPLIQKQYGASSAFAKMLGFDRFNPETGEFDGTGFDMDGGPGGSFRDQNLDPTRFGAETARDTELGRHAFENTLAAPDPTQDLAMRRADETRLAAPTMAQDPRFAFAQDTAVVGDDFRTSPGYEFSVEQGQREVDRKNSAGGNYGGRALMEATRRMQGEADQEYYNWVQARHGDLARQDQAAAAYQGREATDVARGDAAMDNYFGRRAGDVTRQDQAIAQNQAMGQYDVQRQDQAYYNYLQSVGGAAGIQGSVNQGVAASGAAGAGIANAYGNQGGRLASIYQGLGQDRANIAMGTTANVNQSIQSGIGNYLFADYAGL